MRNLKKLVLLIAILYGFISPGTANAAALAPTGADFQIYTVGYDAENIMLTQRNGVTTESMLLQIDPVTGKVIVIGNTGFANCKALDFNQNGNLYAKCQRPEPPHEPVLIMLDPTSGEGTEIGETGITENISDIAIDTAGYLFAYEEPGGDHNLHQVDAGTGAADFIGNPGIEGQGNALFFWGTVPELKLFTWADGQNQLFKLDMETGQPTFLKSILMVDEQGNELGPQPCLPSAMDSLRGDIGLEGTTTLSIDSRVMLSIRYDAVGLIEFPGNFNPLSADVNTNIIGGPEFALSFLDIDNGVVMVTEPLESGYVLDGIAVRKHEPRPIPAMSEWVMIGTSALLLLIAIYFMARRKFGAKTA